MTAWYPREVSLSSGGIMLCGQLGILAALQEAGTFRHVRAWHGCSAGAICAFLGALGVSPGWMRTLMETLRIHEVTQPQEHCVESLLDHWGLSDGTEMVEYFRSLVETWEPGAGSWTFADLALARPGVTLSVIATNLTRGTQQIYSTRATPTVRILDALRASCSIPLYFTPVRDASGDLLCDGAVLEYYPWSYLTDKDNTLVIVVNPRHFEGSWEAAPTHIGEYVQTIARLMLQRSIDKPRHWIGIGDPAVMMFDFGLPMEMRLGLFERGCSAARAFLEWSRRQLTDSAQATPQTREPSARQSISCADHRSPETESDSPECHSPQRTAYPSRDSRSASSRSSRRWSL